MVYQEGDIGGLWASLPPQMQSYTQSNSLWKRSRNQLSNSYTLDKCENTHVRMGRKG